MHQKNGGPNGMEENIMMNVMLYREKPRIYRNLHADRRENGLGSHIPNTKFLQFFFCYCHQQCSTSLRAIKSFCLIIFWYVSPRFRLISFSVSFFQYLLPILFFVSQWGIFFEYRYIINIYIFFLVISIYYV